MGLLNYLTATSLDEDYAHVSARRARGPSPRRGRPGLTALVVLAVFGVIVATAAIQTARGSASSATSRASLVAQVTARRDRLAAQRSTVVSLRRQVAVLRSRSLAATSTGRSLGAQVTRLGVASGAAGVTGPGVQVVVDDAPGATSYQKMVQAPDLQKLVNGLWAAGAEAVSVNGQRLTSLSSIRDAGQAITVNYVSLRPPYTLDAIGDPRTLGARLLDTAGGQTWVTLQSLGLRFGVDSKGSMVLPAARRVALNYAAEAPPSGSGASR